MVAEKSGSGPKEVRWIIALSTLCILAILAGIAGSYYVIKRTETGFKAQQESIVTYWKMEEDLMKLKCRVVGDSAWAYRFIKPQYFNFGKTGVGSGAVKSKYKKVRYK